MDSQAPVSKVILVGGAVRTPLKLFVRLGILLPGIICDKGGSWGPGLTPEREASKNPG